MKFSKKYKQMMKHHKKIIMKDAQMAAIDPFDYGPGLQLLVDHLRFMQEYYALGENVWACEIEGHPSREQCLNMILAAYEDWLNCEDKYRKVVLTDQPGADEQIAKWVNMGYFIKDHSDNPMFENTVFLYKYEDAKENTKRMLEEYEYCRKRFFELLAEHIEYLWD